MSSAAKKICYKCGRRYPCGTCGGTGVREYAVPGKHPMGDSAEFEYWPCSDCEDGWGEAELYCVGHIPGNGNSVPDQPRCGPNPDILCPKCEKELAEKMDKHVKDTIEGHGVRPFKPVSGRTQCKTPNESNVPKEEPCSMKGSTIKIPDFSGDCPCPSHCPFNVDDGHGAVGKCAFGWGSTSHPIFSITPGKACPGPGEYVLTRVGRCG